ncbi:MAG: hypothetical protein A2452_05055 [Candidatus Firestonebacteria bacterium RIFOXYC2_FULL_39_67]|nr:MAG: hypothetical protein A2536_04910 [Candidatus Firestonebacteria bacterium RIFOXYD2_FULL_39_29]OGF52602.1 MAG: hypothetical protein A2497_09440 [Candidatus Firestonebacteria bacterium RifOxyC12_full_39_7]OGF57255.1 MAG: hypothetical protein A2452_05055 [Candidatus Firestonebacteria bacterium RIFOXYC2_FULL_39_67]
MFKKVFFIGFLFTVVLSLPSSAQWTSYEFAKFEDKPLKLTLYIPNEKPTEPMPVFVSIHGGGWRTGGRGDDPQPAKFAKHGYFSVSIDYRLSGEAKFPSQIEDVKCAIRFLRSKAKEFNINPNKIGVWGSSSGGHLAALLGTSGDVKELEGKGGYKEFSSRVQAVCEWCGPVDPFKIEEMCKKQQYCVINDLYKQLFGGMASEKKELATKSNPVTFITKDDPPFLIMHGDKDQIVPHEQSILLYEALKKAGVEATLYTVKDGKHSFGGEDPDKMMFDFFDKHLKK